MGKFVTRGNIDKMTREQAEASANQELQQKIGARGQPSAQDEPVESHFTMPAWARESGGEGLLARIARQRREATTLAPEPGLDDDEYDEREPEPAPPPRRTPRTATARATRAPAARTPRAPATKRATKATKAAKAVKAVKATRVTKATKTTRVTKVAKATKATKAAAKRRTR